MVFFKKETKTDKKSSKDIQKEIDELKKKAEAVLEKEEQKKQMEETEEIEDFESDDVSIVNEDKLVDLINRYIENNGLEATREYLGSVKDELFVQIVTQKVIQKLDVVSDDDKEDMDEEEIEKGLQKE